MYFSKLSNCAAIFAVSVLSAVTSVSEAARIKDIAALSAARPNQLLGYGLVVGLQGLQPRFGGQVEVAGLDQTDGGRWLTLHG